MLLRRGLSWSLTHSLRLQPGLMSVVYEWCNGVSFAEICQLTDVQEGSIVRHIIRLEGRAWLIFSRLFG